MKKFFKSALSALGYEILRKENVNDPFKVQQNLIKLEQPIIFDIGAHVGLTALYYRGLFPQAFIYSFEPFPTSFNTLLEAVSQDKKIFPYQVAFSEKNERVNLNVNVDSETNSLLSSSELAKSYWVPGIFATKNIIEVESRSLDSFCNENNISKIDILKMDVQGNEFNVLTGAREMLSKQSISLIYFEMIIAEIYQGQRSLSEYFTFFESFNYQLFGMYYPARKEGKELIQADFIFTPKP
jgi:FkbM family methyltransferase